MLLFKLDSPSLFSPGSLISMAALLMLLSVHVSPSLFLIFPSILLRPITLPFIYVALDEFILCRLTDLLGIRDLQSRSHFQTSHVLETHISNFPLSASPGWSSSNSDLTCCNLIWSLPLAPLIFDLFLFLTVQSETSGTHWITLTRKHGAWSILPVLHPWFSQPSEIVTTGWSCDGRLWTEDGKVFFNSKEYRNPGRGLDRAEDNRTYSYMRYDFWSPGSLYHAMSAECTFHRV